MMGGAEALAGDRLGCRFGLTETVLGSRVTLRFGLNAGAADEVLHINRYSSPISSIQYSCKKKIKIKSKDIIAICARPNRLKDAKITVVKPLALHFYQHTNALPIIPGVHGDPSIG